MLPRTLLLLLLVATVAVLSIASAERTGAAPDDKPMLLRFREFKAAWNRTYSSPEEEQFRFAAFATNMLKAAALRKTNPLAVFGVTKFSDFTAQEWRKVHGRRGRRDAFDSAARGDGAVAAGREKIEMNWVREGATVPVGNQGMCGDCWAWATAETIASAFYLLKRKVDPRARPVELSVQQLTSCDKIDFGCEGSNDYNDTEAWIVRHRNGTLETAAAYPFRSVDGVTGECLQDRDGRERHIGAHGITGGVKLPVKNEPLMAEHLLHNGPVQISIDSSVLQNYVSGVITHTGGPDGCLLEKVDHEVVVVAVDEKAEVPHWTVQNSWGTDWGMRACDDEHKEQCRSGGYFKVAMHRDLLCLASFPWQWRIKL